MVFRKMLYHGAIVSAFILADMFAACYPRTAYFRFFSVNINGWSRDSVLHYNVRAVKEKGFYVEEIGVRANTDYPFQQLSLVVDQTVISTTREHGNIHLSDTMTINIYDQMGRVNGKGVNFKQMMVPLKNIPLEKDDSISMTIRHNMRRLDINGIADVGLRVTMQ